MAAKRTESTIERMILFPGDWVADRFNVEDEESRMLLRMFVNLSLYAKIATITAYVMTRS